MICPSLSPSYRACYCQAGMVGVCPKELQTYRVEPGCWKVTKGGKQRKST